MLTPVKMMSLTDVGHPIFGGSPPRLAQKGTECEKEFEEHLDRLAELPLYGGCKSTKELLEEKAIEFRTGLKLPGLEGLIEEEDVQETLEAAVEVAEVAEVKEVVDLSDE